MKKFLIILIITFPLFNILSTSAHSKETSIESIISKTNCDIVKKEVLGYSYFSSQIPNEQILKSFITKNFKDKEFKILIYNEYVIAEHNSNENSIIIKISNTNSHNNLKYISIFYSHNIGDENIINLRETIRQMLLPFDNNVNISSHIVGKINEKLSKAEISSLISSMLLNSSVTFNKDYEDSSISYSGYSSYLPSPLKVKDRNINIQASGRYSPSDKCTYIWVGTPIIFTEY